MPDLHDALAAEAERRRPTQHPAFSTLVERRRRRDLRITGAAGTALAALAVMGVAFVPDPVGQRGPETMGPADTLSPDLRDLLEQCIGREPHITETDTFVGLSEAQLAELRGGPPRRVVGRDGECLDRTDELRPGRLNLILEDGAVVWSGVEVGQQMENVQFPVELDEERVVAPADVEALERCASLPGARLEPVRQPAPSDVRIVSVTGAATTSGGSSSASRRCRASPSASRRRTLHRPDHRRRTQSWLRSSRCASATTRTSSRRTPTSD